VPFLSKKLSKLNIARYAVEASNLAALSEKIIHQNKLDHKVCTSSYLVDFIREFGNC